MAINRARVLEVLGRVYDPDYVDRSIVDMGLVTEDDIAIKDNKIEIVYGLTAPMCPFSAAIGLMIKHALEKELQMPVTVKLKDDHRQADVVADLLADQERCQELMAKLQEFGILERCIRL